MTDHAAAPHDLVTCGRPGCLGPHFIRREDIDPGLDAALTAADQPTTEPSAVERAWDDGARAALRSEGYEVTDHAAVLASNPHRLAPAPQPAADLVDAIQGEVWRWLNRHEVGWSPSDATVLELALAVRDEMRQPAADTERPCDRYCTRECTLCRGRADLRELRMAADVAVRDTERDGRLRKAREAATRARTQNPPLGIETWLITLDDEVTRLDAVVTAVREVHFIEVGSGKQFCDPCSEPWPCPTVRALDGGAAS